MSIENSFLHKSYILTLGTILLVVTLFYSEFPILDLIELKMYDLRFFSRGHVQPSQAVVMALVDEKSLATEGRWPWPRSKIATLVEMLSRDKAKVIGLDITFTEPDENSQLSLINQFAQQIDGWLSNTRNWLISSMRVKKRADNDLALAQAIQNSSAPVVLAIFFT
jgi:adenylate cyclase